MAKTGMGRNLREGQSLLQIRSMYAMLFWMIRWVLKVRPSFVIKNTKWKKDVFDLFVNIKSPFDY